MSGSNPENPPVSMLAKLAGDEDFTARLRAGGTVDVRIRQVAIREIEKFLNLLDDEAAMVEFLCGQPSPWADSLEIESHEKIIERGFALNHPTCERFIQRKMERTKWGGQQMEGLLAQMQKLTSLNFAPTPPLSSGSSPAPSSSLPSAKSS
jgi:hypothetical protein